MKFSIVLFGLLIFLSGCNSEDKKSNEVSGNSNLSPDILFVSARLGDDSNQGSYIKPLKTVDRAIEMLQSIQRPIREIKISLGHYVVSKSIKLIGGPISLDISGGWSDDGFWIAKEGITDIELPRDGIEIKDVFVSHPIRVSHLNLRSRSGSVAGANSFVLRLKNVPGLTLRENVIVAGRPHQYDIQDSNRYGSFNGQYIPAPKGGDSIGIALLADSGRLSDLPRIERNVISTQNATDGGVFDCRNYVLPHDCVQFAAQGGHSIGILVDSLFTVFDLSKMEEINTFALGGRGRPGPILHFDSNSDPFFFNNLGGNHGVRETIGSQIALEQYLLELPIF